MKDWEKEINKYIKEIKEEETMRCDEEKLLTSQKEAIKQWKEKGIIYIAVVKDKIVRLGTIKSAAIIPFAKDFGVEKPTIIRVSKSL